MLEGNTACSNGPVAPLPQTYTGFGITSAVIYKGIRSGRFRRELLWRFPDGGEKGLLRTGFDISKASWVDLNEQPLDDKAAGLTLTASNTLILCVGAKKIVSLRIEPESRI